MDIGCVILAGGKSSRMGRDKAGLKIRQQTFIEKLAGELDFFEEKLIAGGNNEQIKLDGWKIIPDFYVQCGPMGGLHCALMACKSEALFCLPCDVPLFERSTFQWLVQFLEPGYDAVVCMTRDGRCHPLTGIYRKSAAEIFEKQLLSGKHRMMSALEQMRVRYVVAESSHREEQLFNVNTPQDYQRLLEYWK